MNPCAPFVVVGVIGRWKVGIPAMKVSFWKGPYVIVMLLVDVMLDPLRVELGSEHLHIGRVRCGPRGFEAPPTAIVLHLDTEDRGSPIQRYQSNQ